MLSMPAGLPAPMIRGYRATSIEVLEQSPTDDGKFRSRPRAKNAPTTVGVMMACNAEQEILFRSFHDFALHQGGDAFLMRLKSGGQMRAMAVQRFGPPPAYDYESLAPNGVLVSFRVIVHQDFGSVLWCDIVDTDAFYFGHDGREIELGTLTGFKISRAYLFGRTGFTPSGSLTVGWGSDIDALIETAVAPSTGNMSTVVVGDGDAGISLGVGQASEKTVIARITTATAPSAGDCCLVLPYEPYSV